jgi:large subunit ribosomal protein L17
MRHQKAGRKLGRTTSHRNAVFRNMLASFFDKEKIETTTAKAKEFRPLAEKLITLGKRGDLHARRSVLRIIPNTGIVRKLFTEIAPRFERRAGGYTRIIRTGYRAGDQAPMSIIELVAEEVGAGKKKEKKKKKAPAPSKPEAKREAAKAAAPARQDGERQEPSQAEAADKKQVGQGQVKASLPEEATSSGPEESGGAKPQSGKEALGAASTAGGEPEKSSEKTE